jgi:hypothetical protein
LIQSSTPEQHTLSRTKGLEVLAKKEIEDLTIEADELQ